MEFEPGGEFDSAGEVLARFIGFIVEKLPDAIDFFNRVTTNLAGPLQQVAKEFQLLTIELVEFAEGAAPGALGVISTLLSVFTSLFDSLNDLSGTFISSAVQAFAFTAVILRLGKAFDDVAQIGFSFARVVGQLGGNLGSFTDTAARVITLGQGFMDQYLSGVLDLSRALVAQIPILKDVQFASEELYDDGELKDFDKRLKIVKQSVVDLSNSIKKRLTGFALDEEIVEAPKMGGFRSAETGRTVSLDLTADKFKQSLGTVKDRMIGLGRQGLATGKRIASGLGKTALGGLKTFTASVVGILHPGLIKTDALTTVFSSGLSDMADGLNKMGLGIIPRVVKGLVAKMGALKAATIANLVYAKSFLKLEKRAIQYAFAQNGVKAGLKQIAISAYSAVKGLLVFAGGLLKAAVAGFTLSASILPITVAVLALTAAGALLVGVLGNMGKITGTAKSSFKGLKNFAVALGDALLGLLVPTFNLLVDIFMALLAPVFAIVDGFMLIVNAIGSAASQGKEGAGIMESFGAAMDVLGGVLSAVAPVFRVIGDIIFAAFITPFRIAATIIGFIVGKIAELIGIIKELVKESGLISVLRTTVENIKEDITTFIDGIVDLINKAIKQANKIPGVDVGVVGESAGSVSSRGSGIKITESDVRDNLAKDTEDGGGDRADTTSPNFSLETNVENTANVDAESDEKEERIKTLVERALKDANTYRRTINGR
jgi:hypothetical protein